MLCPAACDRNATAQTCHTFWAIDFLLHGRVRTVCMTFRTVVTETPRETRLSAMKPPRLAASAMVIQGSTLKMPLFSRSKPSTCTQVRMLSNPSQNP